MPERHLLRGAGDTVVARLRLNEIMGTTVADLVEPLDGARPGAVVAALLATFPGWRVVVGPDLGPELVDAGGRLRRHAHFMTRDLERDVPPAEWDELGAPPGFRLVRADLPAERLEAAWRAAYPPGHPDHVAEPGLAAILDGGVGAILPESALVLDGRDDVVAGILVTDFAGAPPDGGPWVSDVFRDPGRSPRGLGGLLLRRALGRAARAGRSALGLVVTEGNPAARSYERLGFRHHRTIYAVQLPGPPQDGALPG